MDLVGRSSGLIIMWREDCDINIRSYSMGHIDLVVTMDNGCQWRFTGFYDNLEPSNTEASWQLLRRLNGLFSLPWVCRGDFITRLLVVMRGWGAIERFDCYIEL